jgi:hypothetical protein
MRDLATNERGRLSMEAIEKLKDLAYEKVARQRNQSAHELRLFYTTTATEEEKHELRAVLNAAVKRTVAKAQLKLSAGNRLAERKGLGSVAELEEMVKGADDASRTALLGELNEAAQEVQAELHARGHSLWRRAKLAVPLAASARIFSAIPVAVAQPLVVTGTDAGVSTLVAVESVLIPMAFPMGLVVADEAQGVAMSQAQTRAPAASGRPVRTWRRNGTPGSFYGGLPTQLHSRMQCKGGEEVDGLRIRRRPGSAGARGNIRDTWRSVSAASFLPDEAGLGEVEAADLGMRLVELGHTASLELSPAQTHSPKLKYTLVGALDSGGDVRNNPRH